MTVTVHVETDNDAWSTSSLVDNGTVTTFHLEASRIVLRTLSDTVDAATVAAGSAVDVRLNDVVVDQLSSGQVLPPVQVWYNEPVLWGCSVGATTLNYEGVYGYAQYGGLYPYLRASVWLGIPAAWPNQEYVAYSAVTPGAGQLVGQWLVNRLNQPLGTYKYIQALEHSPDGWSVWYNAHVAEGTFSCA